MRRKKLLLILVLLLLLIIGQLNANSGATMAAAVLSAACQFDGSSSVQAKENSDTTSGATSTEWSEISQKADEFCGTLTFNVASNNELLGDEHRFLRFAEIGEAGHFTERLFSGITVRS